MINDNEAANSYFISNEYYFIKKVKPPIVDENIIISYNKIIDSIKSCNKLNKKTLLVGAIKFKDNENIEYIHCPLLNIEETKDICIGVCKHFESVKNDCEGKKLLASHKYQFHYKCKSMKKIVITILKYFLKQTKA